VASQRERQRLRALITADAVRLLAEGGVASAEAARRMAAQRHGCVDQRNWPDVSEIAAGLAERQRLFSPDQPPHLDRLRRAALDAMSVLAAFDPRLAGDVGAGFANAYTGVTLWLYAETPEQVVFALLDRRIPWQESERRLTFGAGRREVRPVFRIGAGGVDFDLVVLRPGDHADPPRDPLSGRPQRGLSREELQAAVARDAQPLSPSDT
jgi:hypothetical protein